MSDREGDLSRQIDAILRDDHMWTLEAILRILATFAEGNLYAGDWELGMHKIAAQGARDWLDIYKRTGFARIDSAPVHSWNWCKRCEQHVDADDIFDGSEVHCHGCDRTYVCVAMNDGSWMLDDVEIATGEKADED